MGLNLIICKDWVLLSVLDKPWITYGQRKLFWEPWSYMGFFSLPNLQKTWPETFELGSPSIHKDLNGILKTVSKDTRLDPGSSIAKENLKYNMESMVSKNFSDVRKHYTFFSPALGSGSFGEVRKAKHIKSGVMRAVKIIKKEYCSEEEQKKMLDEIKILKTLDHPNIIKVVEYFEDASHLYIISEFCQGGELLGRILQSGHLSEAMAREVMHSLLRAVSYCHAKGVVHRDLKPENILYESKEANSNLKIIDYGLSAVIKPEETLSRSIGTLYYVAPEVLQSSYNEKCDIWSLGVILYVLLTGAFPFFGYWQQEIIDKIMEGTYDVEQQHLAPCSELVKDLMAKMLNKDHKARISAKECLEHPWFKSEETPAENLTEALNNMNQFAMQSKLAKIVLYYLSNHLSTADERDQLLAVFRKLDTDKNGMLSRAELAKGYANIKGFTNQSIEEVFCQFDTDRSGTIDYSEFVAAAIDKQRLLTMQRVEQCFKLFDRDGSGSVTAEELKHLLTGSTKRKELDKAFQKVINKVDKNFDGKIQLSEFKEMLFEITKTL